MKQKIEEIRKAYEAKGAEATEHFGKLAGYIEKCAMAPDAINALIEETFGADRLHPELANVEEMTSGEYAKMYRQMSDAIAEAPEKYEDHAKQIGMSPEELSTLFAHIEGTVDKYPEIWESQERAHLLSPKNLEILVDVFKK